MVTEGLEATGEEEAAELEAGLLVLKLVPGVEVGETLPEGELVAELEAGDELAGDEFTPEEEAEVTALLAGVEVGEID